MTELRSYKVGGRHYTMPPLTMAQKQLTGPFESEIWKRISAAKEEFNRVAFDATELIAIRSFGDSATFWSIPNIQNFFGAILVVEGFTFDKSKVAENSAHIETVTPEELVEPFTDFFYHGLSNRSMLLTFLTASMLQKNESAEPLKSAESESTQNSEPSPQ